ncbi:MAG: hypothetical protein DVB22_000477 [Verrucomicrobia bacterium]|nr:MAG: hypothetical protein DVB22_000477 [Verrucomicrobiota bacterium]
MASAPLPLRPPLRTSLSEKARDREALYPRAPYKPTTHPNPLHQPPPNQPGTTQVHFHYSLFTISNFPPPHHPGASPLARPNPSPLPTSPYSPHQPSPSYGFRNLGLRKPAAAFPEPARWPGTTQARPPPLPKLQPPSQSSPCTYLPASVPAPEPTPIRRNPSILRIPVERIRDMSPKSKNSNTLQTHVPACDMNSKHVAEIQTLRHIFLICRS